MAFTYNLSIVCKGARFNYILGSINNYLYFSFLLKIFTPLLLRYEFG